MHPRSVSVVIAAYNRGPRIGRTIDSVLAQTAPPLEIVVSDDASSDHTASWIQSRYPSVRVVTFPNAGTSVARNRGAAAARGDVLLFLDHDDDMLPHAIETLMGLLARFPEARAAFADHSLRDDVNGEYFEDHHSTIPAFRRMRAIPTMRSSGRERLYGRAMYYALLRGNLLQQPWAIYADTFAGLGGFDPHIKYCEDWEMYLRLTDRNPIALTDTVIAQHYIEGQNLHRASGQEVQHMKVLRKHVRRTRWTDPLAHLVLRRRLASYHKDAGDRHRLDASPQAWVEYLKSFRYWPLDAVVAARCVAWSPSGIVGWRRAH